MLYCSCQQMAVLLVCLSAIQPFYVVKHQELVVETYLAEALVPAQILQTTGTEQVYPFWLSALMSERIYGLQVTLSSVFSHWYCIALSNLTFVMFAVVTICALSLSSYITEWSTCWLHHFIAIDGLLTIHLWLHHHPACQWQIVHLSCGSCTGFKYWW